MEYQVYLLDPRYKLAIKGKPIYESNLLSDALQAASNAYHSTGRETAVWQPRTQSFRDYYKNPIKIRTFGRLK